MKVFKSFDIDYDDIIQLDGASPFAHKMYSSSSLFHGIDGQETSEKRSDYKLSEKMTEDIINLFVSSDTTEKNIKEKDRIELWKEYWLEYIFAFDKMIEVLPNSIVTAFVGRQAIEIGLKYLLLKKGAQIIKTHDIGKLSEQLFIVYNIHDDYMEWVDDYCKAYHSYIEGGFAEYYRYPEYNNNSFFGGDFLDIYWLSFNAALVLTKLVHFSGMDEN